MIRYSANFLIILSAAAILLLGIGFLMIPLPTPVTALLLESTLIPAGVNPDWTPIERSIDGVTMVLVPAGCFRMGSTEAEIEAVVALEKQRQIDDSNDGGIPPRKWFTDEYDASIEPGWFAHEMPAHEQCIQQPFWIDKLEVSRLQYKRFGFSVNNPRYPYGDRP